MLANRNAMATIAVKDLAAAQNFYEGRQAGPHAASRR